MQKVLTVALVVEQHGIAGGERVGHPDKSASAPTPIVEMTMPTTTTQTMILTKLSFRIEEMLEPYGAIEKATGQPSRTSVEAQSFDGGSQPICCRS